jgi:putative membrane-bound dehydrogenase-like protein
MPASICDEPALQPQNTATMKILLTVFALFIVHLSQGSRVLAQGYSPSEAVKHMKVPPGFQVQLVASEPEVRKPVTLTFDGRGRMWVIQYLQYPTPNGLKPVKVDQFLRTTYDRIPEPPPKGPKGADRITIFYDPDENGKYRKNKDFVIGLNLASGLALGYGGVFVLQAPYLLFYPDRNGDDTPDGDPEVLLSGFGMEDAHAVANSIQWGPDGWLYGAQGSTVTAHIRGLEFQQGIWRYHPITHEFELFSEGGGNTWGLDFDQHGNVIAGTNWGDSAMLHQVQGAYYVKGFAKHGPLHNPNAFGYFEHVPYKGFKGGHVTCGGVLYEGGTFPKEFENTYIAANLLANSVYRHVLEPKGSSFTAHFGGDFLIGNDTSFRPVDCLVGPDGALYIADWCDKRANHVDPVNNWDRTRGRIYKVQFAGNSPASSSSWKVNVGDGTLDLNRLSSREVVGLLNHPNDWYRREANRILAERRDQTVIPQLRQMVLDNENHLALEALWALYVSGGFDEKMAARCLHHPLPDVRNWTTRFLGDPPRFGQVQTGLSSPILSGLSELAMVEKSPSVRSQLACTCKRLPGEHAIPIIRKLLLCYEDADDPHIPLLLWWAIESKSLSDRHQVLAILNDPEIWHAPLMGRWIVERLARRYMAEGDQGYASCAWLLNHSPGSKETTLLIQGMEKALEGRQLKAVPPELEKALASLWTSQANPLVVRFGLRLGSPAAYDVAMQMVFDFNVGEPDRIRLIETLGQIAKPACIPAFERLLTNSPSNAIRLSALSALQAFPDPKVSALVLSLYPKFSGDLRSRAQTFLLGRPPSALALLQSVDSGKIDPKEISLDQLRRLITFDNSEIKNLVTKHWGQVAAPPPGAKVARINSILHLLGQGQGNPIFGKALFQKHCATCHTLFGEGAKIGPDLTSTDRKNRNFLATSIVDPSAIIRPEFVAHAITTTDGRLLNGIIVERGTNSLTLVDSKTDRTVLASSQVESLEPSPVSLMPEGIIDPLDDQQIRDLFSYLQRDATGQPQAQGLQSAGVTPLKVCLVSGSLEYDSDTSLAGFQEFLEKHYQVKCSRAFRKTDNDLPGLDNLKTCDVMLLFTRRLTIDGEQLDQVKKYCQAGKPIVGVRTASHAFQNWLALDKEILGGNYQGHYGTGPPVDVRIEERSKDHPILIGVKPFQSAGSLYKNPELTKGSTVLLMGSIPGHEEPIAWTHIHNGGRVFYTSLGHPKDFADSNFKQLLVNALFWSANREVAKRE